MVRQFDVIIERDEESYFIASPESTPNKIVARLPSPSGRRAGDEGMRHVLTLGRHIGAEAVTQQNLASLGYRMEEAP